MIRAVIEESVDEMLPRMTLEEKVGLMFDLSKTTRLEQCTRGSLPRRIR